MTRGVADDGAEAAAFGVIGVGSIAAAIVEGLCAGGVAPSVRLSPRNAAAAGSWRSATRL